VPLQGHEGCEAGQAGETEAERLYGRPAGIGGLREGVDEGRQAHGRDHGTAEVEADPLRSSDVGGHDVHRSGSDGDADGQIDQEDGSPVDEFGERAAQQDTDSGAGAAHGTPDAERLRAVGTLERGRDDGQRGRGQHRRAETLSGAGGEEDLFAGRQCRGERRDREDPEAGEEDAAAAEQVRGASPEQEKAPEDQRIARDGPSGVAAGDVQVLREVRQSDVHG